MKFLPSEKELIKDTDTFFQIFNQQAKPYIFYQLVKTQTLFLQLHTANWWKQTLIKKLGSF